MKLIKTSIFTILVLAALSNTLFAASAKTERPATLATVGPQATLSPAQPHMPNAPYNSANWEGEFVSGKVRFGRGQNGFYSVNYVTTKPLTSLKFVVGKGAVWNDMRFPQELQLHTKMNSWAFYSALKRAGITVTDIHPEPLQKFILMNGGKLSKDSTVIRIPQKSTPSGDVFAGERDEKHSALQPRGQLTKSAASAGSSSTQHAENQRKAEEDRDFAYAVSLSFAESVPATPFESEPENPDADLKAALAASKAEYEKAEKLDFADQRRVWEVRKGKIKIRKNEGDSKQLNALKEEKSAASAAGGSSSAPASAAGAHKPSATGGAGVLANSGAAAPLHGDASAIHNNGDEGWNSAGDESDW